MKMRTCKRRLNVEILEDRCMPSTFAAFDLANPESGPFPSDRFTVADSSQLTGRRVDLPLPDAASHPSDYADVSVINTLDGFNLQPRLSIAFSGPIDVNTVNSNTVFLVKLDDTTSPTDSGGQVIGINQTVWDVATNTLHVESDELLDQHTRYALIVTRGVHDAAGQPVEASDEFSRFRHDLNFGQSQDGAMKDYRKELLDSLQVARGAGVAENEIVTASVHHTERHGHPGEDPRPDPRGHAGGGGLSPRSER
jgi:Bacterial Ig-like domain